MATVRDWMDNLKIFKDYPVGEERFVYQFEKEQDLTPLFQSFSIEKTAGEGDTFSKARKIMQWVAGITEYDGGSALGLALPDEIIEFGIHKKQPINCLNRAMLFCDALSTIGVRAIPIWLGGRPYLIAEDRFADVCHSHVIAQVWLPEKKCWAAFDPSFNTFFVAYNKRILKRAEMLPISVAQMVLRLVNGKDVRAIDNETDKKTTKGFICTKIGLLNISIFPGNSLSYRESWESFDKGLYIVPDSYMEKIRVAEDMWNGWKDKMLNYTKISLHDIEGEPK